MRRKVKNKKRIKPDFVYQSERVSKLINYLMKSGKKNAARKIVYQSMEEIKKQAKVENALEILDAAIRNTSPNMEVRSRRVGGANYQVPVEVRPERKNTLSMRWIIEASRAKKGKPMHIKLANELISASKNDGDAVRKKENVHKMAEANKAFAHFAW